MATVQLTQSEAMPQPHPGGQAAFAADWTNRFVALEGGWMSGKTWIGARKLVTLHMFNAFGADGHATFAPSVAVAPTYASARDYMCPHVSDALDEIGARWEWKPSTQEFILTDLGTKRRLSKIMVRSAEKPERITGWEVGAAWGDEPTRWSSLRPDVEPTRDPLLQLTGRIRHPLARCVQGMFTYTNEGDTTSVFEMFHSGRPGHALYRARTSDNPAAADFYAAQRALLSPELVRQYLDGDAVPMRGQAIYPPFERAVHVRADLVLATERPLQIMFDFNISPGMHALIGQYDQATDTLIVTDEFHGPRVDVITLLGMFEQWIANQGGWHWPELQVFGDATGKSAWAGTGETCYSIVQQKLEAMKIPYRFRVPRANPPVVDRINAFCVALRDVVGKPHWYCSPGCKRLLDDLEKMRRGPDGKIDKREADRSHASDAEGYRIHYLRPARVLNVHAVGGRISV